MPIKDAEYWGARTGLDNPCHYLDPALDWYADVVRKNGIRRVWPDSVRPGDWVLDVGCGDGRMGAWLRQEFGVKVCGLDAFEYQGARERLDRFVCVDAEKMVDRLFYEQFDLAIAITSLPFMADWKFCVAQMCVLSRQASIVENTQSPIPEWQKGHKQKTPFALMELRSAFANWNLYPHESTAINVVDRMWLMGASAWTKWPILLATLLVDTYAYLVVEPDDARYTATLFRHERYWAGRE